MSYVQVANDTSGNPVKIYYTDYGIGKPIVLIHGWPLSGDMWEYQLNSLVNSGHRVITYDRRGFGKSSRPWDGYDYDTLADDLKMIIDKLQLKDITLVGFSMGGGEVVRYFSRYDGQNISRTVLISAVTPFMLKTESNPDGVPAEIFDEMSKRMQEDRIAFLDEFGKTFFGVNLLNKPLSTPLLEYYRMLCAFASPRATQECAKSFSTTDFRKEMQSVTVPTLIIHGDADKTVPIDATGRQSARTIADNTFIVYEDAPHGLFYTHRDRLNLDLLQFADTDNSFANKYSRHPMASS